MTSKLYFPIWVKIPNEGWIGIGSVNTDKLPETQQEKDEVYSLAWEEVESVGVYGNLKIEDWTVEGLGG